MGCTKTILIEKIAVQHKLELFRNEQTLVVAANGKYMPVTGTTTLTAGANGVTRKIHTPVSPAITEDMVMRCNDLINLEKIPREYKTAAALKSLRTS